MGHNEMMQKIEMLEQKVEALEKSRAAGLRAFMKRAFSKTSVLVGVAVAALVTGAVIYAAQNIFVDGTVISAAAVNNNFTELYKKQGGLLSMQVFESSGTWTKPAGVTRIEVIVTAGGGGGGSHNADDAQGGGGAGGTAIKIIDVTEVSSVEVTVGAGGTASCGDVSNGGSAGGASSFGSYCSATGGAPPATWAVGGHGGTGTNGDINLHGSDGETGSIDGYGNDEGGGTGGASYWGGGGPVARFGVPLEVAITAVEAAALMRHPVIAAEQEEKVS